MTSFERFLDLLHVLFLMLLALLGFGESNTQTWTEQVELQTGETIAVEREFRWGGGGSKGGPLRYARLEFDYQGKHYRWEEENVWPMVLQVDDRGRVVVGSAIFYESAWRARGKPCDKALLQVFGNGQWKQVPSWEIHVERASNLAGSKKNGLIGLSMSKAPASLLSEFKSRKNTCIKDEEINDVQSTPN